MLSGTAQARRDQSNQNGELFSATGLSVPKTRRLCGDRGLYGEQYVEITLDDLTQVGRVIDTATQSGTNNIQKLEYKLKNSRAVRTQALREAAAEAKASVEAIAAGLGLSRVARDLRGGRRA
jgi:hypothetical protein